MCILSSGTLHHTAAIPRPQRNHTPIPGKLRLRRPLPSAVPREQVLGALDGLRDELTAIANSPHFGGVLREYEVVEQLVAWVRKAFKVRPCRPRMPIHGPSSSSSSSCVQDWTGRRCFQRIWLCVRACVCVLQTSMQPLSAAAIHSEPAPQTSCPGVK